jgi:uncharacterized protein (DUF1499 family)
VSLDSDIVPNHFNSSRQAVWYLAGEGSQTVVDMRSKSRVGKGDLGANAARIMQYFEMVKEAAQ